MKSNCSAYLSASMRFASVVLFLRVFIVFGADDSESPKRIVFEEQQIEGKIRRPQLVLIKAEQRPSFSPMVIQSLAGNTSVVELVADEVIENSPYDDAFRFNGMRISNYVR